MIGRFGDPESLAIKRRVVDAVEPASRRRTWPRLDRHGRTSSPDCLAANESRGTRLPVLAAWLASFDHAG
jgi:hypothetical protein